MVGNKILLLMLPSCHDLIFMMYTQARLRPYMFYCLCLLHLCSRFFRNIFLYLYWVAIYVQYRCQRYKCQTKRYSAWNL